MDKFIDAIFHLVGALIAKLMKRSFKRALVDGKVIDAALDELLLESGADRAVVLQFSNGNKSLTGVPYYYFSATHERITDKPGVYPVSQSTQRIPVTTFRFAIENAIKNDFRWRDCNEIPDVVTRSQCRAVSLKSTILVPLYKSGQVIGLLHLGWVTKQAPDFSGFGAASSEELYLRLITHTKHISDLL